MGGTVHTEWKEFEPQVQYAIDQHCVNVHKQNDRIHAREFEIINSLLSDSSDKTRLGCCPLRVRLR